MSSTLILYVLPSVVDDSVVALLVSMFLYIVRFSSGIYVNSIISSIEMLEVSAPGWTENPERLCWKNTTMTSATTIDHMAIRS